MFAVSPPEVARPGPEPAVETGAGLATPWFTRHMLGVIEADRDRRRAVGATQRRLFPSRTAMAHPRLAAALAAEVSRMSKARVAYSRWADEGGKFDPEAAARLRIGGRKMKRCNS